MASSGLTSASPVHHKADDSTSTPLFFTNFFPLSSQSQSRQEEAPAVPRYGVSARVIASGTYEDDDGGAWAWAGGVPTSGEIEH